MKSERSLFPIYIYGNRELNCPGFAGDSIS